MNEKIKLPLELVLIKAYLHAGGCYVLVIMIKHVGEKCAVI